MANEKEEDTIEVVVVGESGEGSSTEGAASTGPDVSPEEGIAQLQAKLRAAEAARVEAESRARQAEAVVHQEARRADSSDLQVIEGAIASIRQNNDILKANMRAYLAQGKYDLVADINEKMADNAAKLLRLEEGKQALEPTVRNPPPSRQQPQSGDLIEQYIAPLEPRAAAWIRAHPDFVTDTNKRNQMERAHYAAMGEGIVPNTDEYFTFVEGKLGLGQQQQQQQTTHQQQEDSPLSEAAKAKPRAAPPPAAPPSRSNGSKVRVTLSAEEADAARASGLSQEEYYIQKQRLVKEGKLPAH